MFRFFPKNYVWDLSVNLSIEMGAKMGEMQEMCGPLLAASEQPDAKGVATFRDAWVAMADRLVDLAHEDDALGRMISAGEKYLRASNYMMIAERMLAHGSEGRLALYERMQETFGKGVTYARPEVERVKIPYGDTYLTGIYRPAIGVQGRQPLLVQVNGFDSLKEMKYLVGLPQWLAQRGVASLVVDQPGTGDALRQRGLHARHDSEHWASHVVDYLEARADVDPKRIGMEGVSLGGYYCPRAVAFEPRFACGVVWGANHDWRDVQKRRMEKEGNFPVPHYWGHARWVFGVETNEAFMEQAEQMHLDGILDRIRVPFLVTHGKYDSQIPLKWAHATYDQLVNSPKRELKIFDERTGGVQHSSFDNSANAGAYIADWVAEVLDGRTR